MPPRSRRLVLALALLTGCASTSHAVSPRTPASHAPTLVPTHVTRATDLPALPPTPGHYRIHLIDVGTGLAVLVQGADFTLLYDAGSNDALECGAMTRTDDETRVLSYLVAVLGASGGCEVDGPAPSERRRIDHVVLSHPHADHASMLDEVLHCYDVANVWDSGLPNDADFYWAYLDALVASRTATYHTARPVPTDRTIACGNGSIRVPDAMAWTTFAERDVIPLGDGARAVVVHADTHPADSSVNMASVVLRVELGATSLLLTGDIESGPREPPTAPAAGGEAAMLAASAELLDVDLLQVAHHGSLTSSRLEFLRAVSPRVALISAGPHRYGSVVFPDAAVVTALDSVGATVFRTDTHDFEGDCRVDGASDRIGRDRGPGGCDTYVFDVW